MLLGHLYYDERVARPFATFIRSPPSYVLIHFVYTENRCVFAVPLINCEDKHIAGCTPKISIHFFFVFFTIQLALAFSRAFLPAKETPIGAAYLNTPAFPLVEAKKIVNNAMATGTSACVS